MGLVVVDWERCGRSGGLLLPKGWGRRELDGARTMAGDGGAAADMARRARKPGAQRKTSQ